MFTESTISACIVTHNDGYQIEKCLKSIYKVCDEILLTHDGPCDDNTLTIAKKYGCVITQAKALGFAEPHRATQFKEAKGKWILVIDPDEYLSHDLQKNLRILVNSDEADAYFFLWRFWDGKKNITKKWPHRIGVVKKSCMRYLGIQHTDWTPRGRLKLVDFELCHRPTYDNNTWKTFSTKHTKWLSIHAKQILTPVDQIPQFQWNSSLLPKHLEWIKRYDFWIAPFIFIYFLAGALILSFPTEGLRLWKWAFFQAFYYFLLCFEVSRLKREMVGVE